MVERLFVRGVSLDASMRWVVITALALALTGVIALVSVTTVYGADPYEKVERQALYVVAAALAGATAYGVGYRRLARCARPLLWFTWGLLILLLLPGMPSEYGATRWLMLGPVHIQPSEIAKLVMVVFLSAFAAQRGPRLRELRAGFLPAMAYVGLTAFLVLKQPDLGQTLLIIAVSVAVLMVNGLRTSHLLPACLVVGPGLVLFMSEKFGYVRERLDQFLGRVDPSEQVGQALLALGAGGLFGRGLGDGRAHLHFVPKIHNDFILAAIGEQAGLAGCLVLIGLFALLFVHGLRIAFAAPDGLGFSIAFGVSFMIILQAAVNVAVATRSVPSKGTSLPFVSYGGSGLLVAGAAIGLLLSVAQAARETEAAGIPAGAPPRAEAAA